MPQRTKKAPAKKVIRRSVSLRPEIDKRVRVIAERQKSSTNRVLEGLIEAGLEAKEAEKQHFFEVAERFRTSNDPLEIKQTKHELARMIFGE